METEAGDKLLLSDEKEVIIEKVEVRFIFSMGRQGLGMMIGVIQIAMFLVFYPLMNQMPLQTDRCRGDEVIVI